MKKLIFIFLLVVELSGYCQETPVQLVKGFNYPTDQYIYTPVEMCNFIALDTSLVFFARTELWSSKGEEANTVKLLSGTGIPISMVQLNGNLLFFLHNFNPQVFRLNKFLSKDNVETIADFTQNVDYDYSSHRKNLLVIDSSLYFLTYKHFSYTPGPRTYHYYYPGYLWKTRGTINTTTQVCATNPGFGDLTNFSGELVYATMGGTPYRLCKEAIIDGTTDGLVALSNKLLLISRSKLISINKENNSIEELK